jgi:YVTN family beta-propeller protein
MTRTPTLFVVFCMSAIYATTLTGCQTQRQPTVTSVQSPSASSRANNGFGADMMQAMAKMDHEMMAASMSGDSDHDFAIMMIPHHQGAVDMAKAYLPHAKDPALRRLAEEITVEQPQEIKTMQLRLAMARSASSQTASTPIDAGANSDFTATLMQSMSTMDLEMMAAHMTGNPDHDFAAMMIPHHQGAINMAEPFLLHGKDPVLRRLANEIVVTQAQELDVMRRRLAPIDDQAVSAALDAKKESTAPVAVSSHDRVYTGDQTSNTVSVIDPGSNKLLGVIRLGDPVPGALSPLYRGQLLVHGIGFSPDHRTIAVVSVGSNAVTFIDTATNAIKGTVYVGRSPHEAFFTPDGRELWATVRGEDYVSVIDPVRMKEIRRVQTANGPGMVLFRPDGRYAFVPSSFTPELDVVDMKTYQVVARVPQASPFSPNLAVSRDGTEVWFTLKDSGKTQVMSALAPFPILATLDTGPISNHVTLVDNGNGKFAYITVGAENKVKIYRRGEKPDLVATIATGDLPHGIWRSDDGSRVYVGLENQDAVIAIDTRTNTILATIPVGQQPQALVYVPEAVPEGDGTANLMPLGDAGKASHLVLAAPDGGQRSAKATVSVNSIGPLDLLQAAVSGLKPGQSYTLWLVSSRTAPFSKKEALVTFKANLAGAQITQAIGPLRQGLTPASEAAELEKERFLIITPADNDTLELIQTGTTP